MPHRDPDAATSERRRSSFLSWYNGIPAFPGDTAGVVLMSTWLVPQRSGVHGFSVRGSGATSLSIDGAPLAALDQQVDPRDMFAAVYADAVGQGSVHLAAGVPVLVEALMARIPVLGVGCARPRRNTCWTMRSQPPRLH